MGARLKAFAAVGVGMLASSCAGFTAKDFAERVAKTGVQAGGGMVQANVESDAKCKKLDVEPGVKEEYALGGALAIEFVKRGGGLMLATDEDKKLHTYVNVVGKNLAAQSARPTLEWNFGVLNDSEHFNALSAPGGYVFVTRKVLQELDNEGQLAGVLAHEIAHVAGKHAIRKYNEQKVSACKTAHTLQGGKKAVLAFPGADALLAALDGDGTVDLDENPGLLGSLAEKTTEAVIDDGNEPGLEFEADRMAVQLMVSAGYDPDDYRRLIAKTTEATTFANHPKKADRVKKLVEYINTLKPTEGEFAALSTEGLHSPPLKQPDYGVIKSATGVAKDVK